MAPRLSKILWGSLFLISSKTCKFLKIFSAVLRGSFMSFNIKGSPQTLPDFFKLFLGSPLRLLEFLKIFEAILQVWWIFKNIFG